MLIIIQVVNKQNIKTMKKLFYSLVIVLGLGLTSCGASSETAPATDSTAVTLVKLILVLLTHVRRHSEVIYYNT